MKKISPILRKDVRKDGLSQILLAFGTARYGTPLYCSHDHWDKTQHFITRGDKSASKKNKILFDMLEELKENMIGKRMTERDFYCLCADLFEKKEAEKENFLGYMDEFMALKTKPGTLRVYKNARIKIEQFDKRSSFETINKAWLLKFEKWLTDAGCSTNYRSIILRSIRATWNYCIDNEYTELYPFRRFTIKEEPTRKRALTLEQLRTLRDYEVEPHQQKYRDCFMLMFYLIGINICDLFSLTHKSLIKKNAHTYIIYKRAKTGRDYAIKVEPEARALLEKYRGKEHLLCWADEWGTENFKTRMNRELKKIGPYVLRGRGGKKMFSPITPDELSGYWARHTWATIAAQLDIPVEIIGHALGHADTGHRVTNIYIDFNSDKIDQANRTVLDSL